MPFSKRSLAAFNLAFARGKAWKKAGDDSLQKILNENVCAVVQEFKI
jgi:hypothetical protein